MANTYQYQQSWETKIADRLDKPQNWKDVADVIYQDAQTHNLPYIGTAGEPAVSATYLTSAADRSDLTKVVTLISVTQSSETLAIVTTNYDAVYIDYADEAQSNFAKQMELAALLAKKIGERVETIMLADHASWTNIGDDGTGAVGLASTALNVSANNIDDICRGVVEQIQTANGFDYYKQYGGFVVWRPADWTKLVTYMQANGFRFADEALQDGGQGRLGKEALGLFHYVSTSHATGGHLMAGVRKVEKIGILARTFGKTYVSETPASSTAGFMSGTAIHTRLDYGLKVQTNLLPVIYDINVV